MAKSKNDADCEVLMPEISVTYEDTLLTKTLEPPSTKTVDKLNVSGNSENDSDYLTPEISCIDVITHLTETFEKSPPTKNVDSLEVMENSENDADCVPEMSLTAENSQSIETFGVPPSTENVDKLKAMENSENDTDCVPMPEMSQTTGNFHLTETLEDPPSTENVNKLEVMENSENNPDCESVMPEMSLTGEQSHLTRTFEEPPLTESIENLKATENSENDAMSEISFNDENSHLSETFEEPPSTRNSDKLKNSLPYFELPNPDLEQFISETSRTLAVTSKQSSICQENSHQGITSASSTDITESIITFEIIEPLKPIDRFKSKFMRQIHNPQKESKAKEDSTPKVIQLDSSAPPGSKHLVLREMLKEKIAEKKFHGFQTKECQILDEELYDDNSANESDSDNESDADDNNHLDPQDGIIETELNDQDSNAPPSANENLERCIDHLEPSSPSNLSENVEDENEVEIRNKFENYSQFRDLDEKINNDDLHTSSKSKDYVSLDTDSDDTDSDNECSASRKKCVPLADDSDEESLDSDQLILPGSSEVEKDKVPTEANLSDNEASQFSLLNGHAFSQNSASHPISAEPDEGNIIFPDSLPSYQPNGGFKSQDPEKCTPEYENSAVKESKDLPKFMIQSLVPVVPDLDKSSDCIDSRFHNGFKERSIADSKELDDLSVHCSGSQFSYDDVESVCSGSFPGSSEGDKISKPEIVQEQPISKVWDYFEDEAELSGDDHGSDADYDEEYGDVEDEMDVVPEEELPSSEEQRTKIAELFMKRVHDDDVKDIRDIQERFLEGELGDQSARSRKFVWSKANDGAVNDQHHDSSSDTDNENVTENTESWTLNVDKTKWQMNSQQETEKIAAVLETEDINSEGKTVRSGMFKMKTHTQFRKRTRGSALSMDESVIKKFKLDEIKP